MNENKELKLTVASSPHVNSPVNTRSLMMDVLIALIPALCFGVYFFGPRALVMTIVSVAGCEFFEWLYRKLLKKPQTMGDLSAAVTGVLLAFVCPVALPYWALLVGDFFAMFVVKQLFGGLGKNFLNPALAGRAFLMLSYPVYMTTWVKPGVSNWFGIAASVNDAVTAATPMNTMHGSTVAAATLPWLGDCGSTLKDLFIGNVGGCIGEVSALALIIGGVYLIWRGVIHVRIPACYIGTVAVITLIFSKGNPHFEWMLSQVLGGGLMLGAFFMATDYVTSPCTPKGEIIYGVGCGLLTIFIRYFGGYPEGVSYAILLMNVCTPIIEKFTHPDRFGVSKEELKAAKKAAKAAKKGGAEA
ncbi:MAG: RnfABCDGE type electron transport complex subunit D [Clostridiales bacterium]|nr:RnfABCDGE type electron transport complex subunit D [Clostridiales bacterium]